MTDIPTHHSRSEKGGGPIAIGPAEAAEIRARWAANEAAAAARIADEAVRIAAEETAFEARILAIVRKAGIT